MREKYYIVGASLTILALITFKLSDKLNEWYLNITYKPGIANWRAKDAWKYESYLKIRKLFLLIAGIIMVFLSIFIPEV